MTFFEGIVALGVVAIPAWSGWSARRAEKATLVAAKKLAIATAETNAIVARTAAATSGKLDTVATALDGRITQFMAEMTKRVDLAFERGRGVGHEEADRGPLAESQARIETTLEAQDERARQEKGAAKEP